MRSSHVLLLLASAVSYPEELVRTARLPAGDEISVRVELVTPQVAWSAYQGRLWQTIDAGQHWRQTQLPVPKGVKWEPNDFRFGFLDARAAWFLRGSSLYWTTDAGAGVTWSKPVELPIRQSNYKEFINNLGFADALPYRRRGLKLAVAAVSRRLR